VGISGLPLGSPGTKCHLDVAPMPRRKEYYKGEGDGFPPSPGCDEFCEFEVTHGEFYHQKCSNNALTNVSFGLYKFE
jgi:hypothetical protein